MHLWNRETKLTVGLDRKLSEGISFQKKKTYRDIRDNLAILARDLHCDDDMREEAEDFSQAQISHYPRKMTSNSYACSRTGNKTTKFEIKLQKVD